MFVHLSLPDAPLLSKTPNFAACKMPLLRLESSSGSCPLSQLIWEPTITLFSGFPHPPCWSHCAEMAAPHCLQPRPVSRVRVWDLHLTPSTPPPRMSLGNSKSNTFALSASCPLLPLCIIDSHLAPGTEPGAGSFLLTLQACCLTTWPGLCRGPPPHALLPASLARTCFSLRYCMPLAASLAKRSSCRELRVEAVPCSRANAGSVSRTLLFLRKSSRFP